ncbi:MAG: hypothetical protein C0485_15865 [Pirellula sp.]|nr:hypothetical protein [Pirellula sp.]
MISERQLMACIANFATTAVAVLLLANCAAAGPVDSFDDIEFWVGSGSNQAAVAIDWFKDSTDEPALVWGFRWDGVATGQTMLNAIVTADPRLFAKSEGHGALGSAIYGLGYDDGDGEFALDDDTVFDELGFAASAGPADLAVALDADDLYREGWFLGYWHYGLSVGNPYGGGSWKASQTGMTGRTLSDGDWDSWVYTESFSATPFAQNPVAAELPASGDNADFNGDGVVEGGDFLAWQRGFGISGGAQLEQGDANGDGLVDAEDLAAWSAAFGPVPPLILSSVTTIVPEPSAAAYFAAVGISASVAARRRGQRQRGSAWK